MSKIKDLKKDIRAKIDVIKKINDNPKGTISSLSDTYLTDLSTTQAKFGKKIGDFLNKRSKKKQENNDIFGELINVVEGFVGVNKTIDVTSDKLYSKNKLKKYAMDSIKITLDSSKEILLDNVKKSLFVGSNSVCGSDTPLPDDVMSISPKEFDFLNVLTVEPSSNLGKILYEFDTPNIGDVKMNKEFHNTFTNTPYDFISKNGNTLFNLGWDSPNQEFIVTGLKQGGIIKVEDFLNDYYSSIETPDLVEISKMAVLMSIQGDGDNPIAFDKALNMLNRLLQKLFAVCNGPTSNNEMLQNPINQFDDTDEDIEFYFDFDDVEGIDLDDENDRYQKVLRFRDCGNFTIPINENIYEDFIYLSNRKNINDALTTTFNQLSNDAYEQSGGTISLDNLNLSILNGFILNLPKALISAIVSPKFFYPIIVVWKQLKSFVGTAAEMMKKLSKLFFGIIKDLFWKFITEFWKFVKKDLVKFLKDLAVTILGNKYKRYVTIIKALISVLRKILINGMVSCSDLYSGIIELINSTLSGGGPNAKIPSILLSFSDLLPGYSEDRAFMNISERMTSAGIKTDDLYGESNDLMSMIQCIIKGNTEEMDTNGYTQGSNKTVIIPSPAGPIVIPQGLMRFVGKIN